MHWLCKEIDEPEKWWWEWMIRSEGLGIRSWIWGLGRRKVGMKIKMGKQGWVAKAIGESWTWGIYIKGVVRMTFRREVVRTTLKQRSHWVTSQGKWALALSLPIHILCDLGHINQCFWTSVFLGVKHICTSWSLNNVDFWNLELWTFSNSIWTHTGN